jgi:acylglycerol lipase
MFEDQDPHGRFLRDVFKTSNGYELATYTWLPDCGVGDAKGCAFLLHGISSHARFEYLDCNDKNERVAYAGSIPAHLNALGLIVFAHDHPGHGLSTGKRVYWDSMDELQAATEQFCAAQLGAPKYQLAGKPRFVVGMSMGGTIAIQIARSSSTSGNSNPHPLFTGYVLLSPAVRPPDDMFGWYGRALLALASVLNAVAPKAAVLQVPFSEDPVLRAAAMQDELVVKQRTYVRVAHEFLRVYAEIDAHAASIAFPGVLVVVGARDPIVSPSGIQRFIERVQSPDKQVRVFDDLGHEVIREPGCDAARETVLTWIAERM